MGQYIGRAKGVMSDAGLESPGCTIGGQGKHKREGRQVHKDKTRG